MGVGQSLISKKIQLGSSILFLSSPGRQALGVQRQKAPTLNIQCGRILDRCYIRYDDSSNLVFRFLLTLARNFYAVDKVPSWQAEIQFYLFKSTLSYIQEATSQQVSTKILFLFTLSYIEVNMTLAANTVVYSNTVHFQAIRVNLEYTAQ